MGTMLHFRTIRQKSRGVKQRQLVGLPWAADGCPWVGKLRTMLTFYLSDVIRDSAVQLGLTHQRGANGVDSPGRIGGWDSRGGPKCEPTS
jgi:hypothetical protein